MTIIIIYLCIYFFLNLNNKVNKILWFYSLDARGSMRQRTLLVPHILFPSGGTLSLGHWQTTGGGTTKVNRKPFFGYVDELRIWTIFLEASAIRWSRDRLIKYKVNGLVALWLFDESEGTIGHDIIGGHHFYLPSEPTARPLWVFSYARISPPLLSSRILTWKNWTLKVEATKVCRMFILDTTNDANCGSKLGLAHSQFYYISCMEDVRASGSIVSAFYSIIGYADYCQYYLNLAKWPLDRYCNQFPKELVSGLKGTSCNVSCLFGDLDVDGKKCVCRKGYWGTSCSNVCPGGAVLPCNGHGQCSGKTGVCECDHNWMGDEQCTMCTQGWHGNDCEVASTTGNYSSCVGYTGGHYRTFNGARITFLAAGEFKVIRSPTFVMHLRQVPCYDGRFRCIDGLAFVLESSLKFVILASVPGSRKPLVWLNANRLELNQKIIAIGTKYSMEQTTSATLVLRSADDQVIIKIRLVNHRLQFVAQVPKKICLGSVALGGKCDGIFENYHNRTTPLEELYRILPEDSLFSAVVGYKDFSVGITGSEYALKFNGTGVITDIIPAVFTGDFVTIELVYKAIHGNGTVFTYSKETVFSIVLINGEFCLRTDGTISHTGIIFFKLISLL